MTVKQRNINNGSITTRITSKLELRPWKTGVPIAIKSLEAAPDTQNVCLIWDPPAYDVDQEQQQHLLSTNELISSLLEYIGNNMLDLESLSIELNHNSNDSNNDDSSNDATTAMATPPVSAITTLLVSSESIQSLSLSRIIIIGDDLDVNGFVEAIRIHSTLHSLVVRNCIFAKEQHLEKLKHVTYNERTTSFSNKRWKHIHISDNVVVGEDFDQSAPSTPLFSWESPFLSWCLYPITCCV